MLRITKTILNILVSMYIAFFTGFVSLLEFFGTGLRSVWFGRLEKAGSEGFVLLAGASIYLIFAAAFLVMGIVNSKKGHIAERILIIFAMLLSPVLGYVMDSASMGVTMDGMFGLTSSLICSGILFISLILSFIRNKTGGNYGTSYTKQQRT